MHPKTFFEHSERQIEALLQVYTYLADLNALHSKLKIEKEKDAAEAHQFNTLDAYAHFKCALIQCDVGFRLWTFDVALPKLIALACPSGAKVALCS